MQTYEHTHTMRDGWVYGLFGNGIPSQHAWYRPNADRVKQYMQDVRYVRSVATEYTAYFDAWYSMKKEIEKLEQENSWRFSKARHAKIATLWKKIDKLRAKYGDMPYKRNAAVERMQSYRQDVYGFCWGHTHRWEYADNWARSYGTPYIRPDGTPVAA